MINKIALGSANFSQNYGLNNFSFANNNLLLNLLNTATKKKIQFLDTSFDYKLSNNSFKNKNIKNFKIINKIKLPKKNKKTFILNFKKKFFRELKKFKKKHFDYMLFHNAYDLKTEYGLTLLKMMIDLKNKGFIKKIGVSIYDDKELKIAFSKFNPELVQFPLNIFDQRMLKSRWLKILRKKKILLQSRSVFLQGALLKNKFELNKLNFNKKFISKKKDLDKFCQKKKISSAFACVNFIKNLNLVNLITVGFENETELKDILRYIKRKDQIKFDKFAITEKKLIDPRLWKKKIIAL